MFAVWNLLFPLRVASGTVLRMTKLFCRFLVRWLCSVASKFPVETSQKWSDGLLWNLLHLFIDVPPTSPLFFASIRLKFSISWHAVGAFVFFVFFHLAQSTIVLTFCSCWHGYRLCLNSEQSIFFPLHSHFHHSGFYQNISTPFVASCHSRHDKFFTINIHSSKSGRVVVIPPLTDVHSLNQRPRRHIVCHGDTFNN